MEYLRNFCGLGAVVTLIATLLIQDLLQLGCSWLLASWTSNNERIATSESLDTFNSTAHNSDASAGSNQFGSKFALLGLEQSVYAKAYAAGFGAWGLSQAIVLVITSLGAATAGTALHNRMIARLLDAPAPFFVVTPLGRLMNRVVADVQAIDSNIVWSLLWFFKNVQQVFLAVFTMGYTNPWTLIGIPVLALLYGWFALRYRVAARDLRRISSALRSPLLTQMQVLIDGGPVLRAAKRTKQSLAKYMMLLSKMTHSQMSNWAIQQWVTVSLELIAALLILLTCVLAVQERSRGGLAAAEIGFVLSFLLSLPQSLYWLVRNFTNVEIDMVSAERVVEYSSIQNETSWWQEEKQPIFKQPTIKVGVWGEQEVSLKAGDEVGRGPSVDRTSLAIQFNNFSVTYRKSLTAAISISNLSIAAGSKVAVVGSSGSGKSTLAKALLGFVRHEGTIRLGESEVRLLSIDKLRSTVGCVLQDSSIWEGTVLDNLFPLMQSLPAHVPLCCCCGCSRQQLVSVLHHTSHQTQLAKAVLIKVGLWNDLAVALPAGLQGELQAGGAPLSAGQRQLLLLARIMLHPRPILVIDEVASHADDETERRVVDTLCASTGTVLFIAHRTAHLRKFDYILTLESGKFISLLPTSE
jgi:ABC-type multidrug transport system fused ATPase/permease subunit